MLFCISSLDSVEKIKKMRRFVSKKKTLILLVFCAIPIIAIVLIIFLRKFPQNDGMAPLQSPDRKVPLILTPKSSPSATTPTNTAFPGYGSPSSLQGWQFQLDNSRIKDFQVITAQEMQCSDDEGKIYHTLDGGKTWSAIPKSPTQNPLENSMLPSKSAPTKIYKSPPPGEAFYLDKNNGWTVRQGEILHTDDGGKIWKRQLHRRDLVLNAILFVDKNCGWAAGKNGKILHTADGGKTWEDQESEVYATFYGLQFLNEKQGWAIGGNGIVMKTEDGGETWRLQKTPAAMFWAVQFVSPLEGWAVGSFGTVLYTSDGGKTWKPQNSGTDKHAARVRFLDNKTGWVSCYDPDENKMILLHTRDGGKSWHKAKICLLPTQSAPKISQRTRPFAEGQIMGLWFINKNTGWIAGYELQEDKKRVTQGQSPLEVREQDERKQAQSLRKLRRGVILHTSDGGETWIRQYEGLPGQINAIHFENKSEGWAVGNEEVSTNLQGQEILPSLQGNKGGTARNEEKTHCIILYTGDGGKTWTKQFTGDNFDLNEVFFADTKHGWAVGDQVDPDTNISQGVILRTVDGGKNWSKILTKEVEYLNSLYFLDSNHGWAVGNGAILCTTDGGKTWKSQIQDMDSDITGIYFVDLNLGWAVGGCGIMHTSTK